MLFKLWSADSEFTSDAFKLHKNTVTAESDSDLAITETKNLQGFFRDLPG